MGRKRRRQKHFSHVLTWSALYYSTNLSFSRSHIKLEHLNKWPPRHSRVRANVLDVEITMEMSQFAELKTLIENVGLNERFGERRTNGGRAKPTRTSGRRRKTPNWRNRSERRDDALDLPSAIEVRHVCGTRRRRRIALCSYYERAQS